MNLRRQLIEVLGWKNAAYPDPITLAAPWAIGVRHTGPDVHQGLMWADDMIGRMLDADIAARTAQLTDALPWFATLTEPRQAVLIGMVFQMEMSGLQSFKRPLASMRDERWADAANGMRTSLWGHHAPGRAARLARQVETGEWN
jgi:hypothetical protein